MNAFAISKIRWYFPLEDRELSEDQYPVDCRTVGALSCYSKIIIQILLAASGFSFEAVASRVDSEDICPMNMQSGPQMLQFRPQKLPKCKSEIDSSSQAQKSAIKLITSPHHYDGSQTPTPCVPTSPIGSRPTRIFLLSGL